MRFQLVRRALDWQLSAADVLRLVRADPHPVALLGAWAGGSDIVASDPVRVCCPPGPLGDVLDAPLAGPAAPAEVAAFGAAGAAFGGGWIGYLGYALAGQFLPVPPPPGGPRHFPAYWFAYYDHALRRDRATGGWAFEALYTPARADALERRFEELSRRPHAAPARPRRYRAGNFRLTPSAGEHRAAVRQAISYIRRGDIFQANICLRLEAPFAGDPLDAFCGAVSRLDPPYAAFMRTPAGAVASMSPELFLRRTGMGVWSRPIKGTRSRPADELLARQQRELLERSAKDQAENVMIVDLMRNDLSRVCGPGSVRVPALLRAEPHPGVWHLVSDVHGTLAAGTGDGRLIAATFPPGSVTGAPKVRALEVIHELEATPREVYTGAVGYRSPAAGLELNVAIRTFEFGGGRVWLGSGGGIVAGSSADDEYRECLVKARPLIGALNAVFREEPAGPRPAAPASGAPASGAPASAARAPGPAASGAPPVPPGLLPRPAAGVFTSLRVTGGRGHDLGRHLARLEGSTRELFGKHLPPSLQADLSSCLSNGPSGRLRLTARPAGGPLQVTIEVIPAAAAPGTVALHPVILPGGLGAHKWADRRLLASLAVAAGLAPGPEEHLLITDRGGEILETDRASVFAVIGGVLSTPPADGRLLPGVTRAAVLRLARRDGIVTAEKPVTWERLLDASEVFVTNSVQGVVGVRFLAGHAGGTGASGAGIGTGAAWAAGPVTARLQAALASRPARTWFPAARRDSAPRRLQIPRGRAGGGRPAIVVVDNYDSFTYNLAHLLLSNGCQVEVVRNDEVSARDIADSGPGGIVISPGPGTPGDAGISVDTVRACAATTPLLGICLGHQAIAAAHGARITTAPEPVHGQASLITHGGGGVLAGLPRAFRAARYHSLIVEEDSLPPDLLITARGPGGVPMALRHARHRAEGLQFHPESILTAYGNDIIRNFVHAVRRRSPEAGDALATYRPLGKIVHRALLTGVRIWRQFPRSPPASAGASPGSAAAG